MIIMMTRRINGRFGDRFFRIIIIIFLVSLSFGFDFLSVPLCFYFFFVSMILKIFWDCEVSLHEGDEKKWRFSVGFVPYFDFFEPAIDKDCYIEIRHEIFVLLYIYIYIYILLFWGPFFFIIEEEKCVHAHSSISKSTRRTFSIECYC